MAGIYVHIPFCRKACHYCNFHFSTNLDRIDPLIQALCIEIEQRKDFLKDERIDSLYLGGGTPSLLNDVQMHQLIDRISETHDLSNLIEFTIEINPEDVNPDKLNLWSNLGINRLSVGIQSFFDEDLIFMNRAHDAKTSISALELISNSQFDNVSIDLIFGAHSCTDMMWQKNLDQFLSYDIQHLSCYGLTVEENTALHSFIKKGKLNALDEEKSVRQYSMAMELLVKNGYRHYEISNFAIPGFESRHNRNYWSAINYLGLGPAAHSFDGEKRYWTVANNNLYIKNIETGTEIITSESLSRTDKYNEWIMTGLRTTEGCDIEVLKNSYPEMETLFQNEMDKHNKLENMTLIDGFLRLSNKGKFISDDIISDFFADTA